MKLKTMWSKVQVQRPGTSSFTLSSDNSCYLRRSKTTFSVFKCLTYFDTLARVGTPMARVGTPGLGRVGTPWLG